MILQPYPKYVESGTAWLGGIPSHWAVRRLGYYFKERREKVSDRDFPALSVTRNGVVPQLDTVAKTDDGENRRLVRKGDFVINSRSDRKGSSGLSNLDGSVSLISCVLTANEPIVMDFVSYLLRSVPFQEEFYRYGRGIVADLWTTRFDDMRNILLAVPPASEQRAICKFLNRETAKIDALISEQERLVGLLGEKRQAVISHAVTKGLDPSAPMKDSGVEWVGIIPAHWSVKRLRKVGHVQTGVAKGRNLDGIDTIRVPYLRVANVQAGFIDVSDVSLIDIGRHEMDRYLLQKGDVLMNEGGDFDKLGRGQVWSGEINPCVHQNHVFAVRPTEVEPEWLALITASEYGQHFFKMRANQSTNLASISSTNLRELPVICPPEDERRDIMRDVAYEVSQLVELSTLAKASIALLRERRAALISAAVTGKIDVRGLIADASPMQEAAE